MEMHTTTLSERHHHFGDGQKLTWYVPRIIELARNLPITEAPIESFTEIDSIYWFDGEHKATCRNVVDHARRISNADLSRPVILSHTGHVMDGMHRICRALLEGKGSVKVVQFELDPEPDEISEL